MVSFVCSFQVKYDLSLQSNDYEIVDFMMDKFKVVTGLGEPKHRPPPRRYKHETQRCDMEGEYTGGKIMKSKIIMLASTTSIG